jgi:hypothetical protein
MKRVIALLFIYIYLFSATELHQFLKLPVLVEHFSEHKQKDKSLTLYGFLCMHYANNNSKDSDYDKDSKLPFKTYDNCNSTNHVTLLPEQKFCFNSIQIPSKITILNNYYPQFSNTTFLKSIWQPPKLS